MARQGERDRGKERFWRRLLRQWRGSEQSVRAFCAAHQVSEASFYGWRRTIAARDQQTAPRPRPAPPRRVAHATDKPRGHGAPGSRHLPAFVPIRLVTTAASTLEIVLPDGRVVRVPADFDDATLRQLLAVLAEAPPC